MSNLYDLPNEKFEKEITKILHKSKNFRIEKILSCGQTSDWYDQDEAEWVCLLEGKATIEFEKVKKSLKKGDFLLIKPHERHRVSKTSDCIWLCVFFEFIPEEFHYVYLLECADGSLYCGYTNNLKKRVAAHNSGKGAKYTKTRRPVKLVYSEEYETKQEAMRREYLIKKLSRAEKLDLITNRAYSCGEERKH